MNTIEALNQSRQEFESRLLQIGEDQWSLPTPCTEWTVGDLVNHVMLGTRMSVELLAGAPREEVISRLDDDLIRDSPDLVGDFVALADQLHQAFAGPEGLDGTVDHPMGMIPRAMFIGFRVGDYGAHAWDLARAISANEQIDADLVRFIWDDMQPRAPRLVETGLFGEGSSGNVANDAHLQTRWLDLIGRRP